MNGEFRRTRRTGRAGGGHRASGRGRDYPDAHFFFAHVSTHTNLIVFAEISPFLIIQDGCC